MAKAFPEIQGTKKTAKGLPIVKIDSFFSTVIDILPTI